MTLFRKAAIHGQRAPIVGSIVLARPISFSVITAFSLGATFSLCGFMTWGTYAKHTSVFGVVVPDTGMMKIYATQPGIITERRVTEGQHVNAGDVLFEISSDHQNASQSSTESEISRETLEREHSLQHELETTRILQRDDAVALNQKIDDSKGEIAQIAQQIEGQRVRMALASETAQRYQTLLASGFIPKEQAQQKRADLLDQESRLRGLEREQIAANRDLSNLLAQRGSAPLRDSNALAQINRDLTGTQSEWVRSESRRGGSILAPRGGVVAAVLANLGQPVDPNRPLASIIPDGARMQVELYAPSRATGFIGVDDQVLLRYDAFPFQKFGHQSGHIQAIARTALGAGDLAIAPGQWASSQSEALYRVVVRLDSSSVMAYGRAQPLQPGMAVQAEISQDRRRIYEWILEPLYSFMDRR